jgi:hypothetical protein
VEQYSGRESTSSVQGKGVFVLHSDMSELYFAMEPSFEHADDDAGKVMFVSATCSIGGRDAVDEYLACGLFPLSAGFGIREIKDGTSQCQK